MTKTVFNIRLYDLLERYIDLTSTISLETNVIADQTQQLAAKVSLPVDRLETFST